MKVAVVGAGISGLQSALLLQELGADVTVFEARNRLGGRIETIEENGTAIYEAGGEWIDADQPLLHSLVKKYAGELEEAVREPALAFFRSERRQTDDLWKELLIDEEIVEREARAIARTLKLPAHLNREFAHLDALDLDSFLRQHCQSERGYWWMTANLRSDEGEDLNRIGLLGWLCGYTHYINRENLNRGESEMSAYRTPGGFQRIFDQMRDELKSEIRLGMPLLKVEKGALSVRLTFEDATEVFDAVVLTLPPRCLEQILFDPPLSPAKRCAIEACGMSRAIKISWQFDQAWWLDEGFCGRLHTDGPLQQIWDGTRGEVPVLNAYICGNRAAEWTQLADPVQASLYELGQLFPNSKDHFLRGELHDWVHDPYSLGAFSNYAPGYVLEHSEHIRTPEERVFFAGEHTATWVGFIEGALESAHRVTKEVNQ
jgi:monoamine oxidase